MEVYTNSQFAWEKNFILRYELFVCQQEITISYFRVCVKDLAGMESQHDPVTVDYAVIGGK